jgi:N-acetyl-anhydromuramyl-L-alanine amidase AmpD
MRAPDQSIKSPNYDRIEIPVEYAILHYTAGRLESAIRTFRNPATNVSAHLLIDESGDVYELVDCLSGRAYRAHHAGESRWSEGGGTLEGFNDFSLGIELVNPNGNLLPYSDVQYSSLRDVVDVLKSVYPTLQAPARILGHEQIAGWRGKADPGRLFDWRRFFSSVYPGREVPNRTCQCPASLATALRGLLEFVPEDEDAFWHVVSSLTETAVRLVSATT